MLSVLTTLQYDKVHVRCPRIDQVETNFVCTRFSKAHVDYTLHALGCYSAKQNSALERLKKTIPRPTREIKREHGK